MDDRDEFRSQVRDALAHLYDTAHLECHPLVPHLVRTDASSRLTRAQMLRSLLKETVEALRPQPDIPSHMPEWRSYLALHYRYIKEMSLLEVEQELDLSRRQLQRELQKGLDALSAMLWERRVSDVESFPLPLEESGEAQLLRQELDHWEMNRQVCAVAALVDDTRWMLCPTLERLNVTLRIDLPPSLASVLVDPTLTRQSLSKVLRLLAHSTTPGTQIVLTAAPHEQMLDVVLQSEGTRIDETEQDWKSACLLINHQGGNLWQDSALHNAPIVLSLPLASQARILVVDDVEAAHRLFERYLTPHNYQVIGASNGLEALRLAAELHPDLIILDVMMPTVDGWQVLRELRGSQATADIPVVVCSVLDEPELALSLGARAFVKKPVNRLELLSKLELIRGTQTPAEAARPGATANT